MTSLRFGDKLRLLMQTKFDADGKPLNARTLGDAIGMSDQVIQNFLNGDADNPRMKTIRLVCRVYGVSIDYFMCETLDQCRAMLAALHPQLATPLMTTITEETEQLSPKGQRNVARLLEWVTQMRKGDG